MMKKFIYIIPCLLLLMTACEWFELDNYDGYDAAVHGTIIDSKTGEQVHNEYYAKQITYTWGTWSWTVNDDVTGYLEAYELVSASGREWDAEESQRWYCTPDGTYRNDLIFAGTYRLESKVNNYYPVTLEDVVIDSGDNQVDWTVTPYVRILDPEITFDESERKIKATFKLELGDPTKANTIDEVRLCAFPDKAVGSNFNACKDDPGSVMTTGVTADGITTYSLEIDIDNEVNSAEFQYSRVHYLRIAAKATGIDWSTWAFYNSTGYFNLSPVVELDLSDIN